jgi:sugar lactone lactonase YvrE
MNMKTQKTIQHSMNRAVYSGSLALTLVGIIAAAVFSLPTVGWSQTAEWTVYNTSNSGLPYNGATALAVDAQGNIWVGTGRWYAFEGGGLAKFDGENWTVYNTSNSDLPNNDHTGLSIDAEGNIWSGTESGLSKFDEVNWTVYKTHNSGLPNNQTGAPAFDAEGNAWIGTTSGLAKFDGVNWTVYTTGNSGLPDNFIWPIAFDGQGNLWIGTFGGDLAKFDGANWMVYNTANSALPGSTITSLSIDVQQNVWIGTFGGLAKFDGANWMVYNTANSALPHNSIWNLAVDPKGNLWVSTASGLAKFDGVNWTVYETTNSGLSDNNVYCVAFDAQGSVWIGTKNGGLAVYRPQPAVDFNGDGIVDADDMCIMVDHWGEDYSLCDIGPMPWGDGIVDVQDLIVLAEHLFEEVFPVELVAYWKLDEVEGDIAYNSTSNNHGILSGNPTWKPNSGQVAGALEFDGIDDYITTDFVLNPMLGSFSAFAWIKGGSPGQVVISQVGGEDWLLADAEGKLMTKLRRGSYTPILASGSVIIDGDWHHIGIVWDGSHRHLYVDGTDVAEDATDILYLWASNGGLYIGADKNLEAETFFSGLIDDVRIYNRAVRP